MKLACFVGLGGLIGTVARYLLNTSIQNRVGTLFPVGILTINIMGSFAIGFIAAFFAARPGVRTDVVVFLMTGIVGGFTTMSAFALDAVLLMQEGRGDLAALYVGATLGACLAAVWLGQLAAGSN